MLRKIVCCTASYGTSSYRRISRLYDVSSEVYHLAYNHDSPRHVILDLVLTLRLCVDICTVL